MPLRAYSTALRIVVAFAMTLGVLMSPVGKAASHSSAARVAPEGARHAELNAEHPDLDHVHDEGFEDERKPGQAHGHNPADHSHETPNPLSIARAPVLPVTNTWHPDLAILPDHGMLVRHERPPQSFFTA